MLNIEIPDFATLRLEHLVLDHNGTLARDGKLIAGVDERLGRLRRDLRIHILTGNTFGNARAELAAIPCELTILEPSAQAEAKRAYVEALGRSRTTCIGNGRNDRLMLEIAALGIVVVQEEGAAGVAVLAAHVVTRNIVEALDLLIHPPRLRATLRG
jgi:soluble P-type ATPase